MATSKDKIIAKALELLKDSPQGIRYSRLVGEIKIALPDIPVNTIHGTVWNIDQQNKEIYKADRGLFRHVSFKEQNIVDALLAKNVQKEYGMNKGLANLAFPIKIREEEFYQPFADYVKNDLEECDKAIALGKNKFKDKWGTPDVIGIKKPMPSDIIQYPTEVVSAEIKTDANNLITAFGQACAYKIFSHKVYLVVPKNSNDEDISRIESLCLIFGIGLILFDNENKDDPQFEIRVRPLKHEPDMYYANKYLKLVEKELFGSS